jgi:hypothetical protein
MYAICHIEIKPGIWRWTVHFRRRGISHYKSFSDKQYGGSRNALKAAIAWRNRALGSTRPYSRREFREMKRLTTQSTVPGVSFLRPRSMPDGMWQARMWLEGGKRISKSFGVRKFGFRGAFERAVEARTRLLGMVGKKPLLRHPFAKMIAARKKSGQYRGSKSS